MKVLYIVSGLKMPSVGIISECCGSVTPHGKTFCRAILYHRFLLYF